MFKKIIILGTRVQGDPNSWQLLRFLCETKDLDEGIFNKNIF